MGTEYRPDKKIVSTDGYRVPARKKIVDTDEYRVPTKFFIDCCEFTRF